MAQDFYAAFGVGEDDRHLNSIDEDGIAFSAIKALHRENAALHRDNESLRAVVTSDHAQLANLAHELAQMQKTERGVLHR